MVQAIYVLASTHTQTTCTEKIYRSHSRVAVAVHDETFPGVDANHCLPEILADCGDNLGIIVVRDSLDDGLGPGNGVPRLENSRANKNSIHS